MATKQDFLQWLSIKGLSTITKKHYTQYHDLFGSVLFTQDTVNQFLSHPPHNDPNPRAFLNNYKQFLMVKYPLDNEIHKIIIPRRTGRKPRKLPDYPTEEELFKIEEAMLDETEKVMLNLSFYSALRPAGLLALTINNFDWTEWRADESKPAKLKVLEKGESERYVFIKPEVMKRLRKLIEKKDIKNPNKIIWGIQYRRWHQLLTDASKKALGGRVISPHKLRHGGATWLLNNDWTIQELSEFLGHKSIATTQIYAHLDKKKMMEKYARLSE